MADYPVEAKSGNKSLAFSASQTLNAGENITNVVGTYFKGSEVVNDSLPITSLTALTVPAGKQAIVSVNIQVEIA